MLVNRASKRAQLDHNIDLQLDEGVCAYEHIQLSAGGHLLCDSFMVRCDIYYLRRHALEATMMIKALD